MVKLDAHGTGGVVEPADCQRHGRRHRLEFGGRATRLCQCIGRHRRLESLGRTFRQEVALDAQGAGGEVELADCQCVGCRRRLRFRGRGTRLCQCIGRRRRLGRIRNAFNRGVAQAELAELAECACVGRHRRHGSRGRPPAQGLHEDALRRKAAAGATKGKSMGGVVLIPSGSIAPSKT